LPFLFLAPSRIREEKERGTRSEEEKATGNERQRIKIPVFLSLDRSRVRTGVYGREKGFRVSR